MIDARFIHLPRTAGSSIRVALDLERSALIHRTASRWRELEGEALAFTFVRDPWERVVSLFAFFRRGRAVTPATFRRWILDGLPHPSGRPPILYDGTADAIDVRAGQLEFLAGGEWIGRFEEIDRDFARLCRLLEVSPRQLPRVNAARHPPSAELYDRETVARIGTRYGEDIEWLEAQPPKR